MHRVGKPKAALIYTNRPKQLSFKRKPVKVESKLWRGATALVSYKDLDEIKPMLEEVGTNEYFLLDEERFISYQNLSDPVATKEVNEKLKNKQLVSADEYTAKKSDFYLFDNQAETFWILR